jgi:hypothetical protein
MKKKSPNHSENLTAAEIDVLHESGGDMRPHMDLTQVRQPGRETQRVNVDFPIEFLERIDAEANRIGVTRQSWIKTTLARQFRPTG